jgi:hypothetical protein
MNLPQFFTRLSGVIFIKSQQTNKNSYMCLNMVIKMRFLPFPSDDLKPLLYSSGIDHYCSVQDITAKSKNIIFH